MTMANSLRLMAFLLLAGCQQSFRSEDEWLGKRVFWKDSAVVMNGTEVIDKHKVLPLPAEVEEVKGDLLRLGL